MTRKAEDFGPKRLAEAIRTEGFVMPIISWLPVTINGDLPAVEQIAAGGYDKVSEEISDPSLYPDHASGKSEINVAYVMFKQALHDKKLRWAMRMVGLVPAPTQALMAFGATYPDIQRLFRIYALGASRTTEEGRKQVPFLGATEAGERIARLAPVEEDSAWAWNPAAAYLAFPHWYVLG